MFPVLVLAALGGLFALAARSTTKSPSGIGEDMGPRPVKQLGPLSVMPPLPPQAQRLLALLVLFARDKNNPPGGKQFLSYNTAKEAVELSKYLGLHKTALAIKRDGPVPDDEYLPGRTVSVRQSVISYGTTGRA